MLTGNFYILAIMTILFTSSFVPYSFASIESEALEDVLAGCRDGQTLVYRAAYLDYVCVDPSTAIRWVELGLAEIVQESDESDSAETIETPEPLEESEFPGAPPPAPKPTIRDTSDDSECREGNILIYRFAYQDTICTSFSTASTWERLGISEIVATQKSEKIDETEELPVEELPVEELPVEELPVEELPVEELPVEELPVEELPVEELPVEDPSIELETELEDNFDFTINKIDDNIWFITDFDGARSMIIEGNDGLIVIDTLNSYSSAKQSFENINTISDKPVKTIIFTKINPSTYDASKALIEKGDGSVEIVLHEDLLDSFLDYTDVDIPNLISFSSKFLIDISNIKLELDLSEYGGSYQTYIFIPQIDGFAIGDSEYGLMPFILEMRDLENFIE